MLSWITSSLPMLGRIRKTCWGETKEKARRAKHKLMPLAWSFPFHIAGSFLITQG